MFTNPTRILEARTYAFPVELTLEDDGTWSVIFPDLPGCVTMGDSREEALANANEAAGLHVEVLRDRSLPIPAASAPAGGAPVVFVRV